MRCENSQLRQCVKTLNPEILLTKRWFPIPQRVLNHPEQIRAKASKVQFKVIAAGRRSFKTERFLKRDFVIKSIQNENQKYFLGAPTRPQAKLIFWDDLKALSPDYLVADINETELRIHYVTGSKLYVVGLQEYDRVHGVMWNGCGITEYQEADPKLFSTTIQPMLNDTNGDAILEGRPFGKNHFYDDFLRCKTSPDRWASFQWKSEGILTDEQIRNAKEDLGLVDYQREYEASFESGSQRVYYSYSELNNKKYEINPSLPIIIACDFNAGEMPMSWNIGQQIGQITYWTNTLSHQYTNTLTMCSIADEVLRSFKEYPDVIKFYGDYSGVKQTSNSSYSDWQIIENFFRSKNTTVERRTKPCINVRNRNAATNARLCNANNERRMFADPDKCKPLIKDWNYVQRKENGIDLDGSNPERTHCSDACDYYTDYEFPIKGKPIFEQG